MLVENDRILRYFSLYFQLLTVHGKRRHRRYPFIPTETVIKNFWHLGCLNGTKCTCELFEQSDQCTKSAIGPNLFKWDMCTNMGFQKIPRSCFILEEVASVPEKLEDSPPAGSLECNCFWGYVCVCVVVVGGGGREEREKQVTERAEKPSWASSEVSAALSIKSMTPRRLLESQEREVNKAYFIWVKSTKRPCYWGNSYVYSGAFQVAQW